ncbi:MAG: transcription antitermination factor NusB [Clostridium sp.]
MSRKISREKAMELIFSMMLSKDSKEEALEVFVDNYEGDIKEIDLEYIKNTLAGVEEKNEEIVGLIENNSSNWKIDRMSKINVAILKLGIYEMKYAEDVPDRVAINEAIEIAKKYSDEKSVSFVNGVLDSILKSM